MLLKHFPGILSNMLVEQRQIRILKILIELEPDSSLIVSKHAVEFILEGIDIKKLVLDLFEIVSCDQKHLSLSEEEDVEKYD